MKQVLITLLLFLTLCETPLDFAQTKPFTNPPNDDPNITMSTIGDGFMFGHRAAFRIYETPDHTEALVWYGTFRTEQEAKQAIKQSLRVNKVASKEDIKDLGGRLIGNRIVAIPKQKGKALMVIQQQGLNYWIIQSISLRMAMQVAKLIEPAH